ncbi:MAG: hypothetical protein Q8L44_07945 [Sulfuritalea sp.]|nr:hypothetical protein [Sulfuritalea sp.]
MNTDLLRERVYSLSARLSWLGVGADIAALSIAELWGVYLFLLRVSHGET